jgi:hypothetical protein
MTSFPEYAAHSAYFAFDAQTKTLSPIFNTQANILRAQHYHHMLTSMIESKAFPCIGAKAAIKQNSYRLGFYDNIGSSAALKGLSHDLSAFAQEQKNMKGDFTTFAAIFDKTTFKDTAEFDEQVWALLTKLHRTDKQHYDPIASSDPKDANFAFSFAGSAYFVAALSPASPRLSRQFVTPCLVFNAHYQFENMKQKGKFEKLRDIIRANDAMLEGGSSNDIAADFGDVSEAVQYTGIQTKPAQRCPFHSYSKKP